MANEIIQTGNRIEMRAVQKWNVDSNQPIKPYVSQFVEWVDYNVALILVPIYQGNLLPLRTDEAYDLCFYTKSGLFQCRAVVVRGLRKDNNIAMAEMKLVSPLEKFQRRQFYRMNCIAPMKFAAVTAEQLDLFVNYKYCINREKKEELEDHITAQEIEFHEGVVLDISGGGMRFNSELRNVPESVLVIKPEMPGDHDKKVSLLFGRVISSKRIANRDTELYDNRIEFVKIRPVEQEAIITYIFKEERERRKRETDLR
ncbi:MAG: flagellar brake protein [Lachnospiraceae bacterium]|nr:flagellar brake protein [Lachnospiraceae bacterium]